MGPTRIPAASVSRLLACNVYVSEGIRADIISALKDVCTRSDGVVLANTFVDAPYHRSSFMLASSSASQLTSAVLSVATCAIKNVDMTKHKATHPRLGSVDHVSCHPVGPEATLEDAGHVAISIAGGLSMAPLMLPVYLYGHASPRGLTLADIRRRLGYFQDSGSGAGQWQSGVPCDLSHFPPDLGPDCASSCIGVSTVGAVPWLVNFNLELEGASLATAKRIARAVSERGGGLPGVQAMALQHGANIIEVACNLLNPQLVGPAPVTDLVTQLASETGAHVTRSYVIGKSPCQILEAAAAAGLSSAESTLEGGVSTT